jgi:hypothetical protein
VAINGHDIREASFRHVMLLLQGGYRPLTLTFDRGVTAALVSSPAPAQPLSSSHAQSLEDKVLPKTEYSLADHIITSAFSFFWSAPDAMDVEV